MHIYIGYRNLDLRTCGGRGGGGVAGQEGSFLGRSLWTASDRIAFAAAMLTRLHCAILWLIPYKLSIFLLPSFTAITIR